MQSKSIRIDPAEVERLLRELSRHGAVGDTGVNRLVYSEEWTSAMDLCRVWADAAGLEVRTDAVGNLWARLPGRADGPVIVTGSHIDSQCNGGRFDGALARDWRNPRTSSAARAGRLAPANPGSGRTR